jgi:hypothetical protein
MNPFSVADEGMREIPSIRHFLVAYTQLPDRPAAQHTAGFDCGRIPSRFRDRLLQHQSPCKADTANQAIYIMFKKNVREPLVVRKGEVVGILNLVQVFSELLETVDPECYGRDK